jgi:hypothetical protein
MAAALAATIRASMINCPPRMRQLAQPFTIRQIPLSAFSTSAALPARLEIEEDVRMRGSLAFDPLANNFLHLAHMSLVTTLIFFSSIGRALVGSRAP